MRKHTALIDHQKNDNDLLVRIAIHTPSVSALTILNQHEAFCKQVTGLPYVTRCKQHNWVDEDDEWILFEVWTRERGAAEATAKAVRAEVENILHSLMPDIPLSEAQKTLARLISTAKRTVRSVQYEKIRRTDDCPSLRAWLAGDFEKAGKLIRSDKGLKKLQATYRKSRAKKEQLHIVDINPAAMPLYTEASTAYPLLNELSAAYIVPWGSNIHLSDKELNDFWIFDDSIVFEWVRDINGRNTAAHLYDSQKGGTYPRFVENYVQLWKQLTWTTPRGNYRPQLDGAVRIKP